MNERQETGRQRTAYKTDSLISDGSVPDGEAARALRFDLDFFLLGDYRGCRSGGDEIHFRAREMWLTRCLVEEVPLLRLLPDGAWSWGIAACLSWGASGTVTMVNPASSAAAAKAVASVEM